MKKNLILIADPEREVLRDLGNALHDQGYDVRAAIDGSKALEKAILVNPDLVLFDEDCPLIPAKKFIQILRSNPKTEQIPVIVMSQGDRSAVSGYREAVIFKPFNIDEVQSLVSSTLQKMATAQEVRELDREIEGSLNQISLVDLLQIFTLNRKTGLLELTLGDLEGQIFVHDGNVVHGSTGKHRGEKALFRLLEWKEGTFAFVPEKITGAINIRRSTDSLLLEGARQADELVKLRSELPQENVRLEVAPDLKLRYDGLHPVTQQVIDLLEFYNTVGEVVENSRVSDFETFRAIRTLLDKSVIRVVEQAEDDEHDEVKPLLSHDLLYELKVKIATGLRSRTKETRAKICMLCSQKDLLKEFVTGMRKLPGMELESRLNALKFGFGDLGTLKLSENLHLDWTILPDDEFLRPLWQPLGMGMVGGLVIHEKLDDDVLYRLNLVSTELHRNTSVPLLQFSPDHLRSGKGKKPSKVAKNKVRDVIVQLLHQIAS
jgi:CheY-like chemotaxis protein